MGLRNLIAAGAVMASLSVAANAAVLHINDASGQLGTVDTDTGTVTVIGSTGVILTDIAFAPNGDLYGVSFNGVYRIDPDTAATTFVGNHGIAGANALVFGADGTLYAAGSDTSDLFTIDIATGLGASVGTTGFTSGGDLAFVGDDLYLASSSGDLVRINLASVVGTVIGGFGVPNVFGISSPGDGTLFGVGDTSIFRVDVATGMALDALDYGGQGLGRAFGQSFFSEAVAPMAPVPAPAAFLLFGTVAAAAAARRASR